MSVSQLFWLAVPYRPRNRVNSIVDFSQNSSRVLASSLTEEIPRTKYWHANWMNHAIIGFQIRRLSD